MPPPHVPGFVSAGEALQSALRSLPEPLALTFYDIAEAVLAEQGRNPIGPRRRAAVAAAIARKCAKAVEQREGAL